MVHRNMRWLSARCCSRRVAAFRKTPPLRRNSSKLAHFESALRLISDGVQPLPTDERHSKGLFMAQAKYS